MGELVEFPGTSVSRGYLASGEGAGLGVIVIPEGSGLGPHIEHVCDRLAAEGFTALAPDLNSGLRGPNAVAGLRGPNAVAGLRGPNAVAGLRGPNAVAGLRGPNAVAGLRGPNAVAGPSGPQDLSGAVDYLVAHPSVRGHGVGVIGFSLGGGLALLLATARPDQVRAVVPFYGVVPPEAEPDWDRFEAPVEGHYGEEDDLATPETAAAMEQELLERHKEVRLFTYPGVGHAFFNDSRSDAYDDDASRQAWVRTLEFLRAKLG